ncbi:unnamed protein product [Cuscuta campestris]|uniref:Uncharacterized protein n=1 Tax=Cuscuta campestris TaxID=132261 RepID=A0A484N5N4_9ASTE|nr:unnamed protein product [Cuscuta campestris]
MVGPLWSASRHLPPFRIRFGPIDCQRAQRVEFKNDKWSYRYFVIEFPAHSPLDLSSVVLRSSISRTKFVAGHLAEEVYNTLREKGGLILHHSLQDAKLYRKADFYYPLGPDPIPFDGEPSPEIQNAPPAVESNPAMSSSGNQSKPPVYVFRYPAHHSCCRSGGLELPHPDSLDCEGDKLRDQSALKRPGVQPQPEVINTSPHIATTPQVVEEEGEGQKEPELSPAAEKEVEVQKELDASSTMENEAGEQKSAEALLETERETELQRESGEGWAGFSRGLNSLQASHWTIQANLEKMRESVQGPAIPQACLLALNALHFMEQAQQSVLTLTEEYLGGASGNYRAVMLLKEKEFAARALQQKVDSLEQQVQIATYQRGTQDLEAQFDRLRAQISILESRALSSKDKVGSLKAELVERESRIAELESSYLKELMMKHMEAKWLTLEKLGKERQAASKLRSRMGELEKAIATHQEKVATMTARAEALYEEGKFDMQHCIYEAIQSGLPAHRSLDDFISHYGLPLPLPPPDSHADPRP